MGLISTELTRCHREGGTRADAVVTSPGWGRAGNHVELEDC
jgi:predicted CxxxxCH...CXXCH cytochrome family protein